MQTAYRVPAMQVYFAVVVNILLLFCPHPSHCQQPVNCRWGPYGAWSDCDACTGTKVRTRAVEAFAQYGGTACRSEESQVVQCDSHSTCLRQHNCGGRFRCSPSTPSPGLEGQCISMSLVCNGDQDCEDSSDERDCVLGGDHHRVCDTDKTPPNSDLTGRGYDVLTGKLKEGVINTLSFGGQCRKVFSGAHGLLYRLPQSLLRYSFEVHVDSEKSDESYESSWSYMLHLEEDAMYEHHRRTFHEELSESKAQRILILKNQVALARFQNTAPQYLTLSQGFWSSLSSLPLAYDYPVYRRLLQTYGTHYMSEGTLGGQYQALLEFDRHSLESTSTTDTEYQRCWRKVKRRLFRKKVKTVCEKLTTALKSSDGRNSNVLRVKTNVVGGAVGSIAGLGVLDLEHPEANADAYERWASSVSDFPNVIDQKLRPLYELVKEVRCAGLKRRHLELATERYLAEQHPCHCQPCRNNGRPLLSDNQCVCLCRPGTRGPACKQGSVAGEPAGVIHGGWSCWSAWSPCSGGQRSRTRLCNNPSPEGGGVHCSGEGLGRKPCEDPDIEYLKTMEPQCFGLAVPPPLTCGLPPNLPNGLIRSPKDFYAVGSRVQYQCIHGHYLVGETEAQCTASQTWTTAPKHCRKMSCDAPPVRGNVLATPSRDSYEIGDRVSLSCPQGWRLEAEEPVILCSPSLQWSPFRADAVRCSLVPLAPTPRADLDCKLWERPGALGCVCRMAFECLPSLPLCTELGAGRTRLLSACQVGAMRCLGRAMSLANDSECVWPASNTASCPACTPGQICHEGQCVCQNPEACPDDSTGLCVRPADANVAVTMTQCEVGARRCAGSQVTVISIDECPETG